MKKKKDVDIVEWFNSRPKSIQEKLKQYPPDKEYIMKDTGQIVSICSYTEDLKTGECNKCKVISLDSKSNGHNGGEDRLIIGVEFSNLEPINEAIKV